MCTICLHILLATMDDNFITICGKYPGMDIFYLTNSLA